jgi:hypothetical protein
MSISKVSRRRNLVVRIEKLIDDLSKDNGGVPYDDLVPAFRLKPKTRAELRRVIPLLRESRRLLKRCIARENPRLKAYSGS